MRKENTPTQAGRKSAYQQIIKPNLDTIRTLVQWGVPQPKIREILGISRSTWEKYKSIKTEFSDALSAQLAKNVTTHPEEIKRLEEAMLKIALGFTISVKRVLKTKDGFDTVTIDEYVPPNFQACRFLLMNWGGYMSEPAAQAQREREFEHKKIMDEKNNW